MSLARCQVCANPLANRVGADKVGSRDTEVTEVNRLATVKLVSKAVKVCQVNRLGIAKLASRATKVCQVNKLDSQPKELADSSKTAGLAGID